MEKETERSNEKSPRIPGTLRDGRDVLELAGVFKVEQGVVMPSDLFDLISFSKNAVVVLVYHRRMK